MNKDCLFLFLYGSILFAYQKCTQTYRISNRETFIHTCATYFKAGVESGMCVPIPGTEGTVVDSSEDWGKCCMDDNIADTAGKPPPDKKPVVESPPVDVNAMECECTCPVERKWLQWVGILSIVTLGLYVSYSVYKFMNNRKKQKQPYTHSSPPPKGAQRPPPPPKGAQRPPPPPPPPRGSHPDTSAICDNETVSQIESKSCKDILSEKGIENRKDYLRWAMKNHPDKTQDPCATKRFQKVDGCWRR